MSAFRFAASWLVVLLALAVALPLQAKTLTFDDSKCHVDIPDDWTQKSAEGNVVLIFNGDRTKSFVLRIAPVSTFVTVDNQEFLNGVEKGMTAQGGTITDRETTTVSGVSARVIEMEKDSDSGKVYSRMTLVLANGYAYGLATAKLGSPPAQDDELNGIVNSFGFVGTPVLHQERSPAYQLGYKLGVFSSSIVFIGICVVLLIGFGIGAWGLVYACLPRRDDDEKFYY